MKPIKDKSVALSSVLKILAQFEESAIRMIKISNNIKADNYDDVCKLTMVRKISKAIIAEAYRDPPKKKHYYPLEDLISSTRINL